MRPRPLTPSTYWRARSWSAVSPGWQPPTFAPPLQEAVTWARRELDAIAAGEVDVDAAAPSAPVRNCFRREGTIWTLTFDGTTVRLPDAKGLHDLAALLANPGRELHCAELMGAAVESPDTGPALDVAARRDYERRIVELQAELVEAEDSHDQGGADKARLEMDLLVEHLTAATRLGGRSRRSGSSGERARAAVGWRIRAAISRVDAVHPVLGAHLRDAVRTGTWCCYQPVQRWPGSGERAARPPTVQTDSATGAGRGAREVNAATASR